MTKTELLSEKLAAMRKFEAELYEGGAALIAGVDEVGRGPLAGPVCAAAVVLPEDFCVLGVDDSKKLSAKRRTALYDEIIGSALTWGIGMVNNRRIDEINILNATKEAMLLALKQAEERLDGMRLDHILVDAVALPDTGVAVTSIIKGDEQSVSIAAASIIAKVTRDLIMERFDEIYPGYSFASNKGYGTKAHYEALRCLGPTPIHRKTFLKNI